MEMTEEKRDSLTQILTLDRVAKCGLTFNSLTYTILRKYEEDHLSRFAIDIYLPFHLELCDVKPLHGGYTGPQKPY